MNDIEKYSQLLCEAIQGSSEFIRFEKAKKQIAVHPELQESLNSFRESCYNAQVSVPIEDLPAVMEQLCMEQKRLFASPVIMEYISAEQDYCALLRRQYLKLAALSDLQLDTKTMQL